MTTELHHLPSPSHRRKRRVGRGAGSGRGTYAGRGLKGQRSRSGGRRGLKVRGLKQFMMQVPKKRGFTSPHPKLAVLNVSALEQHFELGAKITEKHLISRGLISKNAIGVKILGNGTLTKKFAVEVTAFSASAKNAILNAGGTARLKPKSTSGSAKQEKAKQKSAPASKAMLTSS